MTLTFQGHVTRRHRSRDHSIPHGPFPTCFFRQFFGKTRKHTLQTDRRQTDTTLQHKRDRYNGWTSVTLSTAQHHDRHATVWSVRASGNVL